MCEELKKYYVPFVLGRGNIMNYGNAEITFRNSPPTYNDVHDAAKTLKEEHGADWLQITGFYELNGINGSGDKVE